MSTKERSFKQHLW